MKPNLHSEQIEAHLKTVRERIRRVQKTRGTMVVATVALGGLFVMMGADFFLSPLPMTLRWVMFGVWLLAVLAAAKFGFGPLLKPIGLLQVARWLEGRHPEMEERISTVLELADQSGGVSPELLETLGRAAEADAGNVNATVEIQTARTSRRWTRPAIALLGLLAMTFAVWPHEASRLLVRAMAPFSAVGNAAAGKFKVTPGDLEVLSGDPVRIDVSYDGGEKDLEIWMEMEKGKKISQAMTILDGGYRYVMNPARAGFRYQVRAGREESDGYTVTVWPMPEFLDPRATLDFPKYTGVLPKELAAANGIEAVVGTQVTLAGRTNTAIEAAWLEIGGKRVAEGKIESSANGGRADFTWTLTTGGGGEAVIKFKHRLGREIEALRFPVEVLADMVPEVALLSPVQRDFKVRADEVLPLKYEVTEDFSVAKLSVEVDAGGNAKTMLDEPLPLPAPRAKPPIFRGEAVVSIGGLRSQFPGSNEIRLRVRAEDARPTDLGGPGVGYSEWVTLHIDQNAESLARQELRQEDEGARKTIEEAIRATREGREKMDWHRGEIRNPELNDNAKKDFKKSADQLAQAEATLKELAKQMKEGVHAKKSDEVEKAAETVAKAREEMENSLLQDAPDQRESKLDQARNDAQQAEKQLEEIRNAMDRDRERIEDLARIMDLAQKQQEIARQAEANVAKQDPPETMPDDWKNQQRQVEEAIKQQLRDRPEGRAEALKAQADEAKALAEEARETAKAQENLEQQTKGATVEALEKALAEEQAEIAKEANAELDHAREARNDLADTLPEATTAADAAKDQIAKGETQPAADSAKAAAEAMKDAAKKAGEAQANNEKTPAEKLDQAGQAEKLDELAERQERAAEAMSDLAKGNTAEAMKKMQAAQAETANELAHQIETMPQLDANGAMQDAKNTGNQGSQQAEDAAKKGQQGQLAEASKQHGEAGQNFEKTAQSLDRASEEFNQAAQQAAAQPSNPQQAKVSPQAMAEALQQASQAASNPQAMEAAAQAAAAAKALAQAAEAGRQSMQGKSPGQGPNPPPGGPPGKMAGNKPDEGPREAEADPGVPPELAKLGISSDDWAKIQASLKSDVGAGESGAVPEEYRGLVKGYFESMSNKPNK
ncbi:MAG: DUF4175 family protein [Luteolibacter sp.]|uniref:DUF4175 family protein n=1 Tax=Luteolibacter sp. TaxID=1962973 RepID=UPI003266F292